MVRVKGALEGLPGVSEVSFRSGPDTFTVEGTAALTEEEVRGAVRGQVVLPDARRLLGRLGRVTGLTKAPAAGLAPDGPGSGAG